ncbi:MAG: hypothetical protein A3C82_01470 [Candidatus Wildermuthbacteria bacterium RIFCSPHIGHO2_02_FULL_47_12]|uniref:Uncharacterized protein n=1 Tax=Candidatus Wildermuthbacteria bacterium RIFCSPHIGHO2_02_FULL_47_12 TaxID=1802451 RepID=A0A1G2R6W9_9BACT|nr:MAG: hypothetical protein A3C82_01470 [Candidatus Wildermuthbacteria bacterium RIFCSPHIGHO2_02_FULL_47_12]
MKNLLFLSLFLTIISSGSFSMVFAAAPQGVALTCDDYCKSYGLPKPSDPKGPDNEPQFLKDPPPNRTCICNPLTTSKFTDVVDRILNIIFFVAIAVAPVMIIVAGFKFLTGGGDPKNVTAARQMLIWTAVGFGIILLSKGIVFILRGVIGF